MSRMFESFLRWYRLQSGLWSNLGPTGQSLFVFMAVVPSPNVFSSYLGISAPWKIPSEYFNFFPFFTNYVDKIVHAAVGFALVLPFVRFWKLKKEIASAAKSSNIPNWVKAIFVWFLRSRGKALHAGPMRPSILYVLVGGWIFGMGLAPSGIEVDFESQWRLLIIGMILVFMSYPIFLVESLAIEYSKVVNGLLNNPFPKNVSLTKSKILWAVFSLIFLFGIYSIWLSGLWSLLVLMLIVFYYLLSSSVKSAVSRTKP